VAWAQRHRDMANPRFDYVAEAAAKMRRTSTQVPPPTYASTPADRLLAAAVTYQSAREPRPYREELSPEAAARRLKEQSRAGSLDTVAVDCGLVAAGHRATTRSNPRPDGLTAREIEVLCMVARGASNKQIAESLVISEKTARSHVERTYAKVCVSNRIGPSMYALRQGLISSLD
jgi:DNA-binding NarL/FixJ family response regulator